MFNAPKFSPNFWVPNTPAPAPVTTPSSGPTQPVIYSPEKHGASFADFQATDAFTRCQSEYVSLIDTIMEFAHHHASALTPPFSDATLHTIALHFGDLKEHVTKDQAQYYETQKSVVFGAGKQLFHAFERLLKNDTISLQQRMDAIKGMAEGISTCSGGMLTAITAGVNALTLSTAGLPSTALQKKNQVIEAVILEHVMTTHTYTRGDEVHYVNAYFNYLADAFGLTRRLDPYADDLTANADNDIAGNLAACKNAIHAALTPSRLARTLADDYLSRMREAAAAAGLDIQKPFNEKTVKQAFDVTGQLQRDCLDREFGEVASSNYLIALPSDEPGVFLFELPSQSTRLSQHFMGEMRENKLVDYNDSRTLTTLTEGQGSIRQLGDLFWIDNDGECDPLTAEHIVKSAPTLIVQQLQTQDVAPDEIHEALYCLVRQIIDADSLQGEPFTQTMMAWLEKSLALLPAKTIHNELERTPRLLLVAAKNGNTGVVRLLIEAGVNIDFAFDEGVTALMHAAQNGHAELVRLLIEYGAETNLADEAGWTASMYASLESQIEVLKLLIEDGADIDALNVYGQSAAMCAARLGHVAVLRLLIDADADLNLADKKGLTAAMFAAKHGHVEIVKLLIEASADLDAADKSNKTAVMYAANNEHAEIVRLLLGAGVDLNAHDDDGASALIMAAANSHVDIARVLIAAGADVNASDFEGWTPAVFAAKQGQLEILRLLVEKGANLDVAAGMQGWTAAIDAAQHGRADVMALLIEADANLNAANRAGQTAIMCAAENGHVEIVRLLVEAGVDINLPNKFGETAAMCAAANGQVAVIRYLIEAGADFNARDRVGWTAVIFAAKQGQLEALRLLIENGADLNVADKSGWTAAIFAADHGRLDVLRLLIAKGANINATNRTGWTPLMMAVIGNHVEALQVLLDSGADIGIKNISNDTAETLAQEDDNQAMIALLNARAHQHLAQIDKMV